MVILINQYVLKIPVDRLSQSSAYLLWHSCDWEACRVELFAQNTHQLFKGQVVGANCIHIDILVRVKAINDKLSHVLHMHHLEAI